MQNWIFFSFLDILLLFVDKSKVVFPFYRIKQVQWWYIQVPQKGSFWAMTA